MTWWIVFILLAALLVSNAEGELFPMKRWAVNGDLVFHDCHRNGRWFICLSLSNNYNIHRECACWSRTGFKFPKKITNLLKLHHFHFIMKGY